MLIRYIILARNPAISSTNEMMTDESLKALKENKRMSPKDADNLEYTIKIKQSTLDVLREIAHTHNLVTYDSAIMRLINAYNDKEQKH